MTNKPSKEVQDEPGAAERFGRGVVNALKMPPKPHKATDNSKSPKEPRAS